MDPTEFHGIVQFVDDESIIDKLQNVRFGKSKINKIKQENKVATREKKMQSRVQEPYFPRVHDRNWLWKDSPELQRILGHASAGYRLTTDEQVIVSNWVEAKISDEKFGNDTLLSAVEWLYAHKQYYICYFTGFCWLQLNKRDFASHRFPQYQAMIALDAVESPIASLFEGARDIWRLTALSKTEKASMHVKPVGSMERDIYELMALSANSTDDLYRTVACGLIAFGNAPQDTGRLAQYIEYVLLPCRKFRSALNLLWRYHYLRSQPYTVWLLFSRIVAEWSPELSAFGLLQGMALLVWSKRTMGHLPPFPLTISGGMPAIADASAADERQGLLFYKNSAFVNNLALQIAELVHSLASSNSERFSDLKSVMQSINLNSTPHPNDPPENTLSSTSGDGAALKESLSEVDRQNRFNLWASLIISVVKFSCFSELPAHEYTKESIRSCFDDLNSAFFLSSAEFVEPDLQFLPVDSFFIERAREQLYGFAKLGENLKPVNVENELGFDMFDSDRFAGM